MVQCKKCKLFLSMSKDDVVKCKGACDNVFHKKCVKKQFLQNELCEDCLKPSSKANLMSSSVSIDIDPQKVTVEALLLQMNKKLEVIFKLEKKLDDLTETVDFYAEQYQQMQEFKKNVENKMKAMEQRNVYLEKCNSALEERVNNLERIEKEKNIEIACLIKNKEDENIEEEVKKVAVKLCLNPEDIESVYQELLPLTPLSVPGFLRDDKALGQDI